MKIAIIALMGLALSGCALFPQAAPQLAKAVNKYCTTLSEDERHILRQQVNEAIKPNQACVKCEGDSGSACLAQ